MGKGDARVSARAANRGLERPVYVCGNHAGFRDREDRVDRISDILLPYCFISSETGMEHLYQVSAALRE